MEENMDNLTEPAYKDVGSRGKEIFLDTWLTCFLCLKDSSIANGDEDVEFKTTKFCFRNICRYLKISLKVCFEEVGKPSDNISVMLCPKCASLAKNLDGMIRQIEMMQIMMTHELQVLHKLIISAPEKKLETFSTSIKPQDNLTSSSVVSMKSNLVDRLRQETKEKVSSSLNNLVKTFGLQLRLNRVKVETEGKKSPQIFLRDTNQHGTIDIRQKTTEPIIHQLPMHLNDQAGNNFTTEKTQYELPDHDEHGNTDSSVSVSLNPKRWRKQMLTMECRKLSMGRYQCPFCPGVQTYKNMKVHLVNVHFDKCFASKMLPNVTETIFKKHCGFLMRSIIRQGALKKLKFPHTGRHEYVCSFCNRKYLHCSAFKSHLVLTHNKILEEKLLRLQGTAVENLVSSLELRATGPPNLSQSDSIEIDKHLGSPGSLSTKVCLENASRTLALAPPNSSSHNQPPTNFPCFETRKQAVLAKISKCFKKAKVNDPNAKGGYRCLLCKSSTKNVYATPQNTKLHIVNVHLDKLLENKKLPQISESMFEICCGLLQRSEYTQSQKCPTKSKRQAALCSICEFKKCGSSHHLIYHLVLDHFEIFEGKLVMLQQKMLLEQPSKCSSLGLPDKVPAKKNSVPCFKKRSAIKRKLWSCSIGEGGCGRKFSNFGNLKRHKKEACIGKENLQDIEKERILNICRNYMAKIPSGRNQYHCSICQRVVSITSIQVHMINAHMEVFYVGSRLDNVGEKALMAHCKDLLRTEAEGARSLLSSKTFSAQGVMCAYCDRIFSHRYGNYKCHLVLEHYEILQKKLVHLQKLNKKGDTCITDSLMTPPPELHNDSIQSDTTGVLQNPNQNMEVTIDDT